MNVNLPYASITDTSSFDAKITGVPGGVWVEGTASTTAELICNRCLQSWESQISAPVSRLFQLHPSDPEEELPIEDGGWINVKAPVHDELSLALPISALCEPDCLGLCPECGVNRNTHECSGHEQTKESPFAVLADYIPIKS